jgi:seryl-tRNA synthetase
MLDIQFIRDQADLVKKAAQDKNLNPAIVDEVLRLDRERRELSTKVQDIRAKRNQLNDQLKKARTDELIRESQTLKQTLQELEPALKQADTEYTNLMLQIPNVPDSSVPSGKDASGNQKIREWGTKPTFTFAPKDHLELGISLDILDLDRGSKVAGYRGYYLKNQGVTMHFAVMRYALDKLIEKGFTPMVTPIIDRREAFVNSGHLPWGEAEAYALIPDDPENLAKPSVLGDVYKQAKLSTRSDMYLAGTAEVPLVSYHAGEILNESDLPKLYCGFSPCFRREIGSYGKDTRGIYRVHEFMKIEQVILCINDPEESAAWHEKLAAYAESMLQELNLPYQVMLMCTGDMGEPQMKKYDLETWMPGRGDFGETMSDSMLGDFQARRANIRYRAKDGTLKFVHTLNNTALASPRILIALWENNQQADGSILIPPALQPYCGFDKIDLPKNK